MVASETYDRYEGDRPLFLVFAPAEDDDRFDGQLLCLNDFREGFLARGLVLFEVLARGESRVGGEPLQAVDAESLRLRFGVGADDFLAVLVGKDGTEKERWTEPVPPAALFRAADAAEADAARRELEAETRGDAPLL